MTQETASDKFRRAVELAKIQVNWADVVLARGLFELGGKPQEVEQLLLNDTAPRSPAYARACVELVQTEFPH